MSDILIVHQFENMTINVFGMHFDFIILHVSMIMEVPLLRLQIGPCLKCHGHLAKNIFRRDKILRCTFEILNVLRGCVKAVPRD